MDREERADNIGQSNQRRINLLDWKSSSVCVIYIKICTGARLIHIDNTFCV